MRPHANPFRAGHSLPRPSTGGGFGGNIRSEFVSGELLVAPGWEPDAARSRVPATLGGLLSTQLSAEPGAPAVRLQPGSRGPPTSKGRAVPWETVSLPCVGENRFLGMATGFLGGSRDSIVRRKCASMLLLFRGGAGHRSLSSKSRLKDLGLPPVGLGRFVGRWLPLCCPGWLAEASSRN
jgi:hypothetical protein